MSWWVWLLVAVGLVVVAVIAMSLRDVNRYRRIGRDETARVRCCLLAAS